MQSFSPPTNILLAVGTAVAYGLTVFVAIALARQTSDVGAIWPGNGILLAALLFTPDARYRLLTLTLCAISYGFVNLALDRSLIDGLVFTFASTAEVVVAFLLITNFSRHPVDFSKAAGIIQFSIAAGLIAPLVPALMGVISGHPAFNTAMLNRFGTGFLADALGLLVVTPAIVLLSLRERSSAAARSLPEIIGLFALLIATTTAVFLQKHLAMAVLPILVLVLVAYRLGPALAAAATLLMASIVLLCTGLGLGPAHHLADVDMVIRVQLVQLIICAAFLASLPLAALVSEHDRLKNKFDDGSRFQNRLVSELDEGKAQLGAALEHMSQGLCMFDPDDHMVLANDQFLRIYRLPRDAVATGTTYQQLIKLCASNGLTQDSSEVRQASANGTDILQRLNDGRYIAISERKLANGGRVCTYADVTKEQVGEQRLKYMADHDALTDLAHRTVLAERIEQASARVRKGQLIAVLFIDLDNFKYINDTYGHVTGDALLKKVAGRLRTGIRQTETIARFGGDEFAMLMTDFTDPLTVEMVAYRIKELMSAAISVDGRDMRVGASIGIAMMPESLATAGELLRRADVALYQAKAECRGSHKFFEPKMDRRVQIKRELEQDLREALADQAFELHYQPIIRLANNEVIGFEALIRWHHPLRGMISPSDFIPIAEESGLIGPIGDWVLHRACSEAINWPPHLKISVNFSRAQFNSLDVQSRLEAILAETGLPANRLELEITETMVMADVEKAYALLTEIRALGIEIAMDDFGKGNSSLSCLRSCPFDRLKIDRSFIEDLTTSLEARSILATIVSLATTLGMRTTAEGVETAEQYEIVKAEGCGEMQGYYFSRPRPASEISSFFDSYTAGASDAA
jgi:diguanylate cyclase (GGDEF)-like protein